jgi:hypothetical protein
VDEWTRDRWMRDGCWWIAGKRREIGWWAHWTRDKYRVHLSPFLYCLSVWIHFISRFSFRVLQDILVVIDIQHDIVFQKTATREVKALQSSSLSSWRCSNLLSKNEMKKEKPNETPSKDHCHLGICSLPESPHLLRSIRCRQLIYATKSRHNLDQGQLRAQG